MPAGSGIGHDHGIDVHRVFRIEIVKRFIRRQEGIHGFLRGNRDRHHGMGEPEAVKADHARDHCALGDLVGQHHHVEHFLVVHAIELHPAGIALRDGVLHIVEDGPGSAQAAVGHGHHHREPRAGRPVKLLVHVGQAVCRGCRKDPCAHQGGGHANTHRGVLAFDPDQLGGKFPFFDVFRKDFRYLGLWGDGIGGNYLNSAKPGCYRRGLCSGQNQCLLHYGFSFPQRGAAGRKQADRAPAALNGSGRGFFRGFGPSLKSDFRSPLRGPAGLYPITG